MDQAIIAGKVSFGLGRAAQYIGVPFEVHRPGSPTDPVGGAWRVDTVNAAFSVDAALSFKTTPDFGKLMYYGTFDTSRTQPGDYLVNAGQGTWFVAGQEPMVVPRCVRCNRTLTFTRPGAAAPGPNYYGGDETATETPLLQNWPASIVNGTKGESGETKLPGDTRIPWALIFLPTLAGVQLRSGDIATDNEPIPMRYTLSACELTPLGWRLTAMLAVS